MRYFFALIFVLFTPFSVLASTEFGTKIDAYYRYDKDGIPTIEQRIALTNKISSQYATEYTMEFKGENPKKFKAWDAKGEIKVSFLENKIVLPFNDAVAGKDKTLNFWITYEGTPAVHNGQTWEVMIPRLDYPDEVDSYRIILEIPQKFGRLAFVNPNPSHITDNIYTFASPSIKKSGLVAIFGDFQTLSFNLKYTLDKPGEIAIPSDTSYQRVFYTKIEPKPKNITVDKDGNWIAKYESAPGDIFVEGQANVLSSPAQIVPSPSFEQLKDLTQATKLWPKSTLDLKTPRKIYEYTNSANSFVSLARTTGIPARVIIGFNNGSLGEWPQYWDWNRAMWVSFDSNYLTFFIYGYRDQFPLPTNIKVNAIDYTEFQDTPLETKIEIPNVIYPPLGATVYLTVTNPNAFAIYHTTLSGFEQKEIVSLPPLSSVRLALPIKPNVGLNFKSKQLSFRVGDLSLEYNIDSKKYLLWHGTLAIIASFIFIFMGVTAHQAWSVYLQGRPRRYHLRRES